VTASATQIRANGEALLLHFLHFIGRRSIQFHDFLFSFGSKSGGGLDFMNIQKFVGLFHDHSRQNISGAWDGEWTSVTRRTRSSG